MEKSKTSLLKFILLGSILSILYSIVTLLLTCGSIPSTGSENYCLMSFQLLNIHLMPLNSIIESLEISSGIFFLDIVLMSIVSGALIGLLFKLVLIISSNKKSKIYLKYFIILFAILVISFAIIDIVIRNMILPPSSFQPNF